MHGIIRQKNLRGESGTSYVDINRVLFRYADGRTLTFVPEAGRENFSEDDMLQLVQVLESASSTAEWSEVSDTSGAEGGGSPLGSV